ncbi:MAG TPA: hypothetical protein VFO41_05545 [Alphaproteobacteria bacterium]|nr:hypothetical protein [Alphaproteobacteria bacterium]
MSNRTPPVPPASRSDKGPGDTGDPQDRTTDDRTMANTNPDKIGHQGNSKVNTTNQGYQQDR